MPLAVAVLAKRYQIELGIICLDASCFLLQLSPFDQECALRLSSGWQSNHDGCARHEESCRNIER